MTTQRIPSNVVHFSFDDVASSPQDITVGPILACEIKTAPEWFDLRTSCCGRILQWEWWTFVRSVGRAHLEVRQVHDDSWPGWIGRIPNLAYFGPDKSQFVLTPAVVFVVLLLGGLSSSAANSLPPNTLKKLAYKKKLRSLADTTAAISIKVDSRLRVLLRLERNSLAQNYLRPRTRWPPTPSDIFQQVDAGGAA